MENQLLIVGYHKGEMDFAITGSVENLSLKQLKEFREMIIVAIWCAEDMWRRANPMEKPQKEKNERP